MWCDLDKQVAGIFFVFGKLRCFADMKRILLS